MNWTQFGTQMEVSGYHHNVMWDFSQPAAGLYAAGDGEVRFDFKCPSAQVGRNLSVFNGFAEWRRNPADKAGA